MLSMYKRQPRTPGKKYEFNGKALDLIEWSKQPDVAKRGITLSALRNRIYARRWPIERAITESPGAYRNQLFGKLGNRR
jgi:hypothetical protein